MAVSRLLSEIFKELDQYTLDGATVREREFGRGAFAAVHELQYNGLKCAGKMIHPEFYDLNITSEEVRRFADECHLLSRMRHPNIVQFLGVTKKRPVPILVMEYLPINLSDCIEKYCGSLPSEIKYSILYDVSLGLKYLHKHNPPIIHRDLTTNNVLLASNMTAKISDLGVSKILNLNFHQLSRMTPTPGTLTYMPPEVMVAKARYNTSVDLFSYGIMMIHVFCEEWPHPKCEAVQANTDGKLTAFSEAQRRNDYLCSIGHDHPLRDLILKCISNNPANRGSVSDVVKQLKEMVLSFPPSFTNRVEMLSRIEALEAEKRGLLADSEQKDGEIKCGLHRIRQMETVLTKSEEKHKAIVERQKEQHEAEIERLELSRSIEINQLQLNVEDLKVQVKTSAVEKHQRSSDVESFRKTFQVQQNAIMDTFETQKEKFQQDVDKEKAAFSETVESKKTTHDKIFASHRMIQDMQCNAIAKLHDKVDNARLEITTLEGKVCGLESEKKQTETLLASKDKELDEMSDSLARREIEILSKESALAKKGEIIRSLNDHLSKIRTYLSTKQQPIQQNITWKQCADLPIPASLGQTTVIDGKVYFGGFITGRVEEGCNVYCYDPSQDTWNTLPPLPVWWFGLGQVKKQLVAVGGGRVSDGEISKKVYVFDAKSRKWKPESLPPMSIARHSPAVISHPSALVVAGGEMVQQGDYVDAVEILNVEESKWNSTVPLPTPCRDMTPAVIKDVCFLAGGRGKYAILNGVLRASIDELLSRAKVNNDCSNESDSNDNNTVDTSESNETGGTQEKGPVWVNLPDSPTYQPAVSVLAENNIVAIGGGVSPQSVSAQSSVFALSQITDSWNYIGDLPSPRHGTATAALSPTEILVIGGWDDKGRKNTVFRGTLTTVM